MISLQWQLLPFMRKGKNLSLQRKGVNKANLHNPVVLTYTICSSLYSGSLSDRGDSAKFSSTKIVLLHPNKSAGCRLLLQLTALSASHYVGVCSQGKAYMGMNYLVFLLYVLSLHTPTCMYFILLQSVWQWRTPSECLR